ncbi:hypothetical protein CHS0354_027110 [Potamilus streckersoni]|uniref:Ion transport domain-containing protein n=1 Tax=Potamilus streckersoni TaxID=2493646 RepID=A0AAE0S112_9BIVA|nr:hypothetical protein CHS0354_027110 [Potamilus streckersoni]
MDIMADEKLKSPLLRKQTILIATSCEAGEDGDFVQLRKVRQEKRSKESGHHLHQSGTAASINSVITDKNETEMNNRPASATNHHLEKLRRALFACVDANNREGVVQNIALIQNNGKLTNPLFVDPETRQNVLHYALSQEKYDIAKYIILQADDELLCHWYEVTESGIHGKRNALHIITEKKNRKLAKLFLSKFANVNIRLAALKLETAVDIEGQRPRLFSCLLLAAYHGASKLVRLYLDSGMDVNHTNSKKDTALLWAAKWGHTKTVRVLLDRGADANVMNDKGSTALYWAVRYEQAHTVKRLLRKSNASPNITRKLGLVAPLIVASAYGNNEIVKLLVSHPETDVNICIRGGEIPIHHAASEGHLDVLQTLVAHGAHFNQPDELGDTALLSAAQNEHVDIVRMLITLGADVNHRNHEGHDTWYYAIQSETTDLLQILVELLDMSSQSGVTTTARPPLCITAASGRCDKIEFMLQMGLNPMESDIDKNTFLHHAAMNDQFKVIEEFKDKIKVDSQNMEGNTPLHIACLRGYKTTVKTLLSCKAEADIKNTKGKTALHVAAYSSQITPETVKELVAYTIKTHAWESLNAKDFQGNNALHIAGKFAKPNVMWEFRFVRFKDKDNDGNTPLHEAVRPGEPEALHKMLDIFEAFKRDAKINEQNFEKSETALHLAADEGFGECVKRLIYLDADLSLQDSNGDTPLHRLVKKTVSEPSNLSKHLHVFDIILENVVFWWCKRKNIPYPEQDSKETHRYLQRQATLFLTNDVHNNDGLSVLGLSFKVGAPQIIKRLLMMKDVTMFESQDSTHFQFDITHITPMTNTSSKGCCGGINVSTTISCLDWFIIQETKTRSAQILDLPPMKLIERYYSSLTAWTFVLLLICHIIYMSLFTFIGVELQRKLRINPDSINASDAITILLYVIVPLEPAVIIILFVIFLLRSAMFGHFVKRTQLSRKRGFTAALNIITDYSLLIVSVIFAGLVAAWIGLFSVRYEYQDYFLAAAICIGWLMSIAFTRGVKMIHYFYRLLLNMILRDVSRFIIVYLFVMFAFGFSLHVLFQVSDPIAQKYDTPGDTLFLSFNMLLGMDALFGQDPDLDTEFRKVGRTATYSKIFYIIYLILSTIILLNLLIAMMNDSYSRVLQEHQVDWRIESVSLGIEIEKRFPLSRHFGRVRIHYGPLGCNAENENLSRFNRWYVEMETVDFNRYSIKHSKHIENEDSTENRLTELEQGANTMEDRTQEQLRLIQITLSKLTASLKR